MQKIIVLGLVWASSSFVSTFGTSGFATSVVDYYAGSDHSEGHTNPSAALGEPSRVTPGQFGGPVDPFSPPYLAEQVVSVGAGGWLTVQFDAPIMDDPANAFGLDFIIFGNAGFIITNGDFTGGGITDGSLFSANPGETKVSVSSDGLNYYELVGSLAPVVDGLFPTDGSGDFHTPVDPELTAEDFNGLGLAGIRGLYNGSAGGAGFDISSARDGNGELANLPSVRFVRVDVLSGASEIDGFAVVPEPSPLVALVSGLAILGFFSRWRRNAAAVKSMAAAIIFGGSAMAVRADITPLVVRDDFSSAPVNWQAHGAVDLFEWNGTEGELEVTWDSSRPNSYFYLPLGMHLTRNDSFRLSFGFQLEEIAIGTTAGKPYTFQIAFGLVRLANAFDPALYRSAGVDLEHGARNLVEFNYFPDSGFGATVAPTIATKENQIAFSGNYPLELQTGRSYVIEMTFTNEMLFSRLVEGETATELKTLELTEAYDGFGVNALAFSSYSDEGQTPSFAGSVRAKGSFDNAELMIYDRPRVVFEQGGLQFESNAGWSYYIERMENSGGWLAVAGPVVGTGGLMTMENPEPSRPSQIFRIRAERP